MFVAPGKWLILQDSRFSITERQLTKIFEDFHIFPDSEVTIGQRIEDTTVKLLSIYRPNAMKHLIFEDRGIWSAENHIKLHNNDESSRRRTNIVETQLKAATVV